MVLLYHSIQCLVESDEAREMGLRLVYVGRTHTYFSAISLLTRYYTTTLNTTSLSTTTDNNTTVKTTTVNTSVNTTTAHTTTVKTTTLNTSQ